MNAQDPKTLWFGALFDVSGPYLYLLVLPVLVMFALGYRRQALTFALVAGVVGVAVRVA